MLIKKLLTNGTGITGCAVAQHCYNGDVSFLWEKWKLLGKGVKCNFLCDFFIFIFFSDQRREETPGRILTRNGSKDAQSRKDVPFWGYKMKN